MQPPELALPNPGRRFKRVRPNGRPFKLTPEVIDKIASYVRTGSYIETAAIAAGVSKAVFYMWLKAANDVADRVKRSLAEGVTLALSPKEQILLRFLDAVEKAQAEAELADVVTIRQASAANWQAAAWRLERKFPDKWGRRDTVKTEISGPGGAPVQTETTDTTGMSATEKDELLERHYERIRRRREQSDRAGE